MKKLAKLFLSGIIAGSMMFGTASVFANSLPGRTVKAKIEPLYNSNTNSANNRVVKVSVGSTTANINGTNKTLSIAPYIQQPSGSMMIPLRFVSTALGIAEENIKYNPINKEITITNNGTVVKYIANTTEMSINGEVFDMAMTDNATGKTTPIYTEIKNGSTFIPLRSLEAGFGVTIEWENTTKTAILTNNVNNDVQNTTNNNIQSDNSSLVNTTTNSNQNNNQAQTSSTALTEQEVRAMEEEVVRLVNEERAKYGVKPLEIKEDLMQSARAKSEDMAKRDYYSHTDPDGYAMYKKTANAENLGATNTPEEVVNGWMNSEGHRKNMLNPNYKYIGVGLAYGKATWWYDDNNDHPYWTQHFSR